MKQLKNIRIILWTALLLTSLSVLPASGLLPQSPPADIPLDQPTVRAQHPSGEGSEEWLRTGGAMIRTLRGDCPANYECLELCINGAPVGEFECWPAAD